MFSSLGFFLLLGLGMFYLSEVLLAPQVYIRPLAPLLFYVSLRDSLPRALILAVFLGLLQDSYALAPFGVHLLSSLIMVGLARLVRPTFLVKSNAFLILAMLVAMVLQELGARLILSLVWSRDMFLENLSWSRGLEMLVTAGLTPVFFALIRTLERHLGRLGRPRSQTPAAW